MSTLCCYSICHFVMWKYIYRMQMYLKKKFLSYFKHAFMVKLWRVPKQRLIATWDSKVITEETSMGLLWLQWYKKFHFSSLAVVLACEQLGSCVTIRARLCVLQISWLVRYLHSDSKHCKVWCLRYKVISSYYNVRIE